MADPDRATVVAKDHKAFDRPTLMRLGAWGLCALASIALVVYVAQTNLGTQRAAAAVAAILSPPRDAGMTVTQVMARTAESEREARHLTEIVRSLSSERDRLALRVDSVEREMGDLTGSITRTRAAPLPAPAASAPKHTPIIATPTVTHAVVPPPPMVPHTTEAASIAPSTVATSSMLPPVPPPALDPATSQAVWPRAGSLFTPPAATLAPPPAAAPALSSAPSGLEEVLATMIPPADMPEETPLPLPRPPLAALEAAAIQSYAAAAAPDEPAGARPPAEATKAPETKAAETKVAETTSPETTSSVPEKAEDAEPQPKVEIGVDLGPALSIARLRTRWEAFRKAHGTTAETVRPLVAIREIAPGKPVELRLVVGPFADVGVAANLCASLAGSQFPCKPAVFDGQRLALH